MGWISVVKTGVKAAKKAHTDEIVDAAKRCDIIRTKKK